MDSAKCESLLSCISDIYQTVDDPTHWQAVLQRLSSYVSNGKGAITARSNDSGYVDVLDLFNTKTYKMSDSFIEQYLQEIYPIDIWIDIEKKHALGDICIFKEQLPIKELEKTEFYNLWLKPQGITDGVAIQIFRNQHFRIVLNIFHNDSTSSLDKLIEYLKVLIPHLCRASSLQMDGGEPGKLTECSSRTEYLIHTYGLTKRQLEAATTFIRLGSRKEAAMALNVAESTIKSHVDAVKEKMGNVTTHELMLKLFSFFDST